MGRGDPQAPEILDPFDAAVGGYRNREPAPAVAEASRDRQRRAGFSQQVRPRDPEIGHRVGHELGDIGRPHEQDVEVHVLNPRHEAAVVFLEHEPGIVEQGERRLDEPALVRDCQAQTFAHQSPVVRSSISR